MVRKLVAREDETGRDSSCLFHRRLLRLDCQFFARSVPLAFGILRDLRFVRLSSILLSIGAHQLISQSNQALVKNLILRRSRSFGFFQCSQGLFGSPLFSIDVGKGVQDVWPERTPLRQSPESQPFSLSKVSISR